MKTLFVILLLSLTSCITSPQAFEISAGPRYFDQDVADLNYETNVGYSYLVSPETLDPISFEVGISRFSDRVQYHGHEGEVEGLEVVAGARYAQQLGSFIPYVGTGFSGTYVSPSTDSGVTWEDDTTLGAYVRAGIQYPISHRFYIGVDARFIDADMFSHQLYDLDGEVLSVVFGASL